MIRVRQKAMLMYATHIRMKQPITPPETINVTVMLFYSYCFVLIAVPQTLKITFTSISLFFMGFITSKPSIEEIS